MLVYFWRLVVPGFISPSTYAISTSIKTMWVKVVLPLQPSNFLLFVFKACKFYVIESINLSTLKELINSKKKKKVQKERNSTNRIYVAIF